MKKIIEAPPVKKTPTAVKTSASNNNSNEKTGSYKKIGNVELGNRYIHQVCTQEELLGEAASTEYYNWLSLQKLISIETEKKDFAAKEHHIEGPKIIYRDRRGVITF